jgi:hypothetical protein
LSGTGLRFAVVVVVVVVVVSMSVFSVALDDRSSVRRYVGEDEQGTRRATAAVSRDALGTLRPPQAPPGRERDASSSRTRSRRSARRGFVARRPVGSL